MLIDYRSRKNINKSEQKESKLYDFCTLLRYYLTYRITTPQSLELAAEALLSNNELKDNILKASLMEYND